MNPTTYRTLCSYAGSRLLWSHPWPVPAVVPFPLHVPIGVYVVVDDDDRCCYVGSVCRSSDRGLADRLAEHLEDPATQPRECSGTPSGSFPSTHTPAGPRSVGSRASSGRISGPMRRAGFPSCGRRTSVPVGAAARLRARQSGHEHHLPGCILRRPPRPHHRC